MQAHPCLQVMPGKTYRQEVRWTGVHKAWGGTRLGQKAWTGRPAAAAASFHCAGLALYLLHASA